ncbi:hypothetical protein BO1005MUT1_350192 [Hyphomicrobiales bacterium]|nr:hypothetical protein BO1005MUT1_350192 [Hyphomicrobiales bacterium]
MGLTRVSPAEAGSGFLSSRHSRVCASLRPRMTASRQRCFGDERRGKPHPTAEKMPHSVPQCGKIVALCQNL